MKAAKKLVLSRLTILHLSRIGLDEVRGGSAVSGIGAVCNTMNGCDATALTCEVWDPVD